METIAQADRAQESFDHRQGVAAKVPLCLEVRRADGQVARVVVDQARCSLGGRPDCTVRLPESADRVDCLIIRGPSGAVARNWSGLTRLNGRAFRDAPVQAGDIIEIAGTAIRVLGGEADAPGNGSTVPTNGRRQSTVREGSASEPPGLSGAMSARAPSAAGERDKRGKLAVRLRRHAQLHRSERMAWRRLRSRLERRAAAYARLASRLQARIQSQLQPRLEQIEAKRLQLEERARDLEEARARYAAAQEDVQRRQRQLAEQSTECDARQQQLQLREEDLAALKAELLAQRTASQSRAEELTAREQQFTLQTDELARQWQALDTERQRIADTRSLQDQRQELEEKFAAIRQSSEALEQKQCFLNEAQLALDAERSEMQARVTDLNHELDSIRQQRDAAQQQLKLLRDELVATQVQLCQERDGRAEFDSHVAVSEQRVHDLEAELKDAHAEWKQLTTQLATLTEQNLALQQVQQQLHEEMESLLSAKDHELERFQLAEREHAAELARGDEQRSSWEQERLTLQAELERYRQAETSWKETQENKQSSLRRLEADLVDRRALSQAEGRRFEQQIADLQSELEAMRQAERAGISQEQTAREEIASLQQQCLSLQQQLQTGSEPSDQQREGPTEPPIHSLAVVTWELREAELLQTVSELEQQVQLADQDRKEWESERERLVTSYEQQINEITNLLRELPDRSLAFGAEQDLTPDSDSPTDTPSVVKQEPLRFVSVPDAAPTDTASILAKYGLDPCQETEDAGSESIDPATDGGFCRDSQTSREAADHDRGADEKEQADDLNHQESIESYMARLLGHPAADSLEDNDDRLISESDPASATDRQPERCAAKKEEPPREKLSLPPKRVNPHAGADLSAMRELAITSTRLAIAQHDVRKKVFRIMSGVFKVLIAVMVGLILIVWGKSSHQWISLLGILVVLGAGYYGFRHVTRRRRQTSAAVSTHREPPTESPARKHGAESRTVRP